MTRRIRYTPLLQKSDNQGLHHVKCLLASLLLIALLLVCCAYLIGISFVGLGDQDDFILNGTQPTQKIPDTQLGKQVGLNTDADWSYNDTLTNTSLIPLNVSHATKPGLELTDGHLNITETSASVNDTLITNTSLIPLNVSNENYADLESEDGQLIDAEALEMVINESAAQEDTQSKKSSSGSLDSDEDSASQTDVALSVDMLVKRINEQVKNIRTGTGDRVTSEFIVYLLQRSLNIITGHGKIEDGEQGRIEDGGQGRIEDGNNSTNSSTKKIITSEDPRIVKMLDTLHTSHYSLDILDFSKPFDQEFKCIRMKLDLEPQPVICSSNSLFPTLDKDMHFEQHGVMLLYFIRILELNPGIQAIDIGAKFGKFTFVAAAMGRPVLAVEPNRFYHPSFQKGVLSNGFESKVTLVTNSLSNMYKLQQLVYKENDGLEDMKLCEVTETILDYDLIDPKDVIRTVTLNDLHEEVKFKKALMKIELQWNLLELFQAASHFFHEVFVRFVLMHWKYSENPMGYDFIVDFLKRNHFEAKQTPYGGDLSDEALKQDHIVIVWVKRLR